MDWVDTNGVVLRYELSGTGHVPLWLTNDPERFAAINRMLTEIALTQQYGRITRPTLVIGCTYDTPAA